MAVSLEPAPWAWPTMAAPCGAAGSCRFEGCGGAAGWPDAAGLHECAAACAVLARDRGRGWFRRKQREGCPGLPRIPGPHEAPQGLRALRWPGARRCSNPL